ncbi:class-II fumarase/aspartase family protein [Amycolatopsis speibonae]|uniref:Adenylosuccinate lyase family protein n=1 Tax=Amycolatopsis speibonae TaxID=1450224 RepID=A0ABV7P3I5_9PSEU
MTGTDSGLLSPVWAGTDPAALVSDESWLAAMLQAEVALARAQAEFGMVPLATADVVEAAARSGRVDLVTVAERARGAANPVVALVESLTAAVAAKEPTAADFVHRGGTSQDIMDSAAMLLAARVCAVLERDLSRTGVALAGLVSKHRATPMAGRTLTQHAVPITFGLKAAIWSQLVMDALTRVRRVAAELPAQLGGAAGTLASYEEYARIEGQEPCGVELSRAFARHLGLAEPLVPWHVARTPVADLGAVLAFVTGALGKFALDVQTLSRTEIGEVAEPPQEGRGVSSAMPQKCNPVLATLIVSAARQVPPYALVLTQSMLAEDERAAGGWQAEWHPFRECLRLAAGATHTAAELAEGLQVYPQRMRANLELTGGNIVSERLTAVLTAKLGKLPAKKLLTRLARKSSAAGTPLAEVLLTEPELAGVFNAETANQLCDPQTYLGASIDLADRVLKRASTLGVQGFGQAV